MPLATSNSQVGPAEAYQIIRNSALAMRQQATIYNQNLSAGNVTALFIFQVLDQVRSFISNMQMREAVSGLDDYATAQGYSGSITADIATCVTAAQSVIGWAVSSFPASGGYLQAETLNTDGSRTQRQFTPTQTAGWQTAINNLIASIS